MFARSQTLHSRQHGTALVMALVFLVVLTILGVTAMGSASLEEKMAGNVKEQTVAFQASETALRGAETRIQAWSTRVDPAAETGVVDTADGTVVQWKTVDWNAGTDVSQYGSLTNVLHQPKYVIEDLGEGPAPDNPITIGQATPPPRKIYYRVTAHGTGGVDAAQAEVQTIYVRQFN